jgi:hypothetical protein
VNQFLAHEFDRCDLATSARGLDLILNYLVNELSAFISVSVVSIFGLLLCRYLSEVSDGAAFRIECKLPPKQFEPPSQPSDYFTRLGSRSAFAAA